MTEQTLREHWVIFADVAEPEGNEEPRTSREMMDLRVAFFTGAAALLEILESQTHVRDRVRIQREVRKEIEGFFRKLAGEDQ